MSCLQGTVVLVISSPEYFLLLTSADCPARAGAQPAGPWPRAASLGRCEMRTRATWKDDTAPGVRVAAPITWRCCEQPSPPCCPCLVP